MPTLEKLADVDTFLAELTELSRKHGLGITGEAVLFVMEYDDNPHAYHMDDESRLAFG